MGRQRVPFVHADRETADERGPARCTALFRAGEIRDGKKGRWRKGGGEERCEQLITPRGLLARVRAWCGRTPGIPQRRPNVSVPPPHTRACLQTASRTSTGTGRTAFPARPGRGSTSRGLDRRLASSAQRELPRTTRGLGARPARPARRQSWAPRFAGKGPFAHGLVGRTQGPTPVTATPVPAAHAPAALLLGWFIVSAPRQPRAPAPFWAQPAAPPLPS